MRDLAGGVDWARPVVVIDVDGVLAPFVDGDSDAWEDWTIGVEGGYLMVFSPEMARRLAAVEGSRVWLTTWQATANEHLLGRLGWEPLGTTHAGWEDALSAPHPKVPAPTPVSGVTWWKLGALAALLQYVADDPHRDGLRVPPALVWADDQLDANPAAGRWAACLGIPTLLVSPTPQIGLTRTQVAQIEAFVNGGYRNR